MTDPSESPYSRNARADETVQQRRRLYEITGTEHVFWVAHATVGEWREWRRVCETNAIDDPLNLRGFPSRQLSQPILQRFPLADGSGFEDENLTTDLGQSYDLEYLAPELQGTGYLWVQDVAPISPDPAVAPPGEHFQLAFQAPGDAAQGVWVDLKLSLFKGPNGDTSVTQRTLLFSESGEYAVDIELNIDTFLIAWLMRCMPLTFQPLGNETRAWLTVPTLELPRGRGDA